jgi:hypothetical protein
VGGSHVKLLNVRLGENTNAFVGALRLLDPAMPDLVAQSH